MPHADAGFFEAQVLLAEAKQVGAAAGFVSGGAEDPFDDALKVALVFAFGHERPGRRSVGEQGVDRAFASEFFASVEEGEFDEEDGGENFTAELFNEFERCGSSAASGQEIISEQHGLTGEHGILVDFDGGGAVFEVVAGAEGFPGQLAFFAHRNKAGVELLGDEGAKDEPARVDADDLVYLGDASGGDHAVDGLRQQFGVCQDGSDVLEQDARFRKIRHVTDGGGERLD
jgi:hypothetical protein